MLKKNDPTDPATWTKKYRGCGICDKFGSEKPAELKEHLKKVHGKKVK